MPRPIMSFEAWLASLNAGTEPVGDCEEWQGQMRGKVPVIYSPRNAVFEGAAKGYQGVRTAVWVLAHGKRPEKGHVIRMRCCNERCVKLAHMKLFTYAQHVKEQARRGELSTVKRCIAARRRGQSRSKLSADQVQELLASPLSGRKEAARLGVNRSTVSAIRSGKRWAQQAQGASVFSWRPGSQEGGK